MEVKNAENYEPIVDYYQLPAISASLDVILYEASVGELAVINSVSLSNTSANAITYEIYAKTLDRVVLGVSSGSLAAAAASTVILNMSLLPLWQIGVTFDATAWPITATVGYFGQTYKLE